MSAHTDHHKYRYVERVMQTETRASSLSPELATLQRGHSPTGPADMRTYPIWGMERVPRSAQFQFNGVRGHEANRTRHVVDRPKRVSKGQSGRNPWHSYGERTGLTLSSAGTQPTSSSAGPATTSSTAGGAGISSTQASATTPFAADTATIRSTAGRAWTRRNTVAIFPNTRFRRTPTAPSPFKT